MNDVEVQSICDYLEECLFEPSINWSPEQFAERSYSRWAVSEILDGKAAKGLNCRGDFSR